MEEKRLDFNAPLLSLRRHASSSSASVLGASARRERPGAAAKDLWPSVYNDELKSAILTNPVMIPFDWEHKPGKAKDFLVDDPDSSSRLPERSVSMPRLPPGRMVGNTKQNVKTVVEAKKENLKFVVDAMTQYTKTVVYEGREFGLEKKSRNNGNGLLWPNSLVKVHGSCLLKEKERENSEGSDYDAFSDALETFSLDELSLFNGSVSNMSALDGHESKRIENSVDLQERSFMMDRFLPAAKAVVSEMPQYAPRKQPSANDPAKQRSWDQRDTEVLLYQPKPRTTLQYALKHDEEVKDDDDVVDVDEDDDLSGNSMARVCGILPWSMKNSLRLINPICHGACLKNKNQMSLPSVSRRDILRSKSNGSASFRGSDQMTWKDVYRHKLVHNVPCPSLHDSQRKPSDSGSCPSVYEGTANSQVTCWSDAQTQDGSSSCTNSADGIVSSRKEASCSFREWPGFLGIPKSYHFDGLDMDGKGLETKMDTSQSRMKGSSSSMSSADANTLRVDSVCAAEISDKKSRPEEIKELSQPIDKGPPTLVEDKQMQAKPIAKCLVCKKGGLDLADEPQSQNIEAAEPIKADAGLLSGAELQACRETSKQNVLKQKRGNMDTECRILTPMGEQTLGSAVSSEGGFSKEQINGNHLEVDSDINSSIFHAAPPPPLPKSPSESWLFRALPAVSKQKSSSLSLLPCRSKRSSTKALAEPRWEAIIKSINLDHGHLRYSEELDKIAPHQRGN